jgi:hypothetical protein
MIAPMHRRIDWESHMAAGTVSMPDAFASSSSAKAEDVIAR